MRKDQQEAANLATAYEELQAEADQLRQTAVTFEHKYTQLEEENQTIKAQHEEDKASWMASAEAHATSSEKQQVFDLQARLATSEADRLVALQDAERTQREMDALDKVLQQFRSDHKQQVRFITVCLESTRFLKFWAG